jgi:ubiquinone/menaquinone biosynthesis C-methylase UbiE
VTVIVNSVFKYDITSSSYDQLYRGEQYIKYQYIFVEKKFIVDGAVADIGCGTGLLIEFLKEEGLDRFEEYFCIEPSHGMLTRLLSKNVLDHRIIVVNGYGENLPLKDESVDHVFLFTVWNNVYRKKRLLEEIERVLKPGGYAIISAIRKSRQKTPRDYDHRYDLIGCRIDCFYLFRRKLNP